MAQSGVVPVRKGQQKWLQAPSRLRLQSAGRIVPENSFNEAFPAKTPGDLPWV